MGIVGVQYKIMPSSPDVDLEEIKDKIKEIGESQGGENKDYFEEPIAFGLKAIIAFFYWPEEKELNEIERDLKLIENVNSVQMIDIRKLS